MSFRIDALGEDGVTWAEVIGPIRLGPGDGAVERIATEGPFRILGGEIARSHGVRISYSRSYPPGKPVWRLPQ